jgi:ABC-type multidrug transport system ATPase subunit
MPFSLKNISCKIIDPDGKSRPTLRNLTLKLCDEERVGLLGRNGSGKTTLLRLLSGLTHQTSGHFIINGAGAHHLHLVFQRPEDHFSRSTVGQLVSSYARRSIMPAQIFSLLEDTGLPADTAFLSPFELSTGQQRLVAIACCLASPDHFLAFDEPFAGLDFPGRQLVRGALLNLVTENGQGWVISSHHPDDLAGLVERLWVLEEGQLIYDGPIEQVPVSTLLKCLAETDPCNLLKMRRQAEAEQPEGRG